MLMDADKYQKFYDDMAKRTGDPIVDLPDGMLGIRHLCEDGWWFIIALISDVETGKLRWALYDWEVDEPSCT
jgi:hypothetical protein